MVVQVVAREIGEGRRHKTRRAHAFLVECGAGDFHHHMRHPVGNHLHKKLLQLERRGRSAVCLTLDALPHIIDHRANHPDGQARRA